MRDYTKLYNDKVMIKKYKKTGRTQHNEYRN